MRALLSVAWVSLAFAAVFLGGCSAGPSSISGSLPLAGTQALGTLRSVPTPALITFDAQSDSLAYFPVQRGGGQTLRPIDGSLGISDGYALAANGNVIIVANYQPAEVVTYNLATKSESTMRDPYGNPYDVAVDKKGNIYAMNETSVAVYENGSSHPTALRCDDVATAEAIAVDNEGDVFVNGYTPSSAVVIVKYPAGSTKCAIVPHLRAERGYIAGVGIDPKTDDLIVVDDPDLCAGGIEGRMIIYPKPYEQRTSIRRILQTTYCAGTFRLDASSTHIFYSDATVSAGVSVVDQARYPSGTYEGRYGGYYSSATFAGFTTLPNRLPN